MVGVFLLNGVRVTGTNEKPLVLGKNPLSQMATILDLPLDVAAIVVELSCNPAGVSSTCRFLREATKAARKFERIEVRRPWLGKAVDHISKTERVKISVPDEDDSNAFVEWSRTRPNRGFSNVGALDIVMAETSFRPMSTLAGITRAFPRLETVRLESSEPFVMPRELVFPAKGFENLVKFEVRLHADTEAWLEIFAGFPQPPKLRSIRVRA